MIITIDRATPSQNEVLRKYRNVHARKREQQWWDMMVRAKLPAEITPTLSSCDITVVRHGERLLDWDNMMAGVKFLMDALVHNKVIEDDNPGVVKTLNQAQVKAPRGQTKTEILIAARKSK